MNATPPIINEHLATLIRLAIQEDLGVAPGEGVRLSADRTTELAIEAAGHSTAVITAKSAGVIAGTFLLPVILREYYAAAECNVLTPDSARVVPGQKVARLSGPARALLSAERVLLNFLARLSGVATLTRRFVDAVAQLPHPPAICDTRKTTPGFRALEKYAVACGGGVNHRMGLYDGVMLKDNHLAALHQRLGKGLSLAQLTAKVRGELAPELPIWLEVDTLEQLEQALPGGGADIILLDNFTPEQMRKAVSIRNDRSPDRKPLLEASGGITLENVVAAGETGVDRISIGALTHSAPALDLSMEMV